MLVLVAVARSRLEHPLMASHYAALAAILSRPDVYSPLEVVPCDEGWEARISWAGGLALKVAPSYELAISGLVEDFVAQESPFEDTEPPPPHQSVRRMLDLHFRFAHLPAPLREVSRPFSDLANRISRQAKPSTPEVVEVLRKLWEAKNSAVLAVLESREWAEKGEG